MYIAKGPFKPSHQERALTQIVQARVKNQLKTEDTHTWYLALLNLENYLARLEGQDVH